MPRTSLRRFVVALMLVFLVASVLPAEGSRDQQPRLDAGMRIAGSLIYDGDAAAYCSYMLDIPEGALAVRIFLEGAGADLSLYLKEGEYISDYADVDFSSDTDEWNEELILFSIFDDPVPGTYWLDVVFEYPETLGLGGSDSVDIPYTVCFDVIYSDPVVLDPGNPVDLLLEAEGAHVASAVLEVPEGTAAIRFDVLESSGDIDLYLSRSLGTPAWSILASGDTGLGREHLIYREAEGNLEPGRYYLTVAEAREETKDIPVHLVASLGDSVPESAPRPPSLPGELEGFDAARAATVQIITTEAVGSGCIVHKDGLILTNDHVVRSSSGGVEQVLWVAVSLDPFAPPEEWYTAEVVDTSPEDDMALVRITGDLWGRPLMTSPDLPVWRLGDTGSLAIGNSLFALGYPTIGSGQSRAHFTLTRGILSGGELDQGGLVLKHDAIIGGGSSGGPLADSTLQLIGLNTFSVGEDGSELAYAMAIDRIPAEWMAMIGR